jgi:hypothetical protein
MWTPIIREAVVNLSPAASRKCTRADKAHGTQRQETNVDIALPIDSTATIIQGEITCVVSRRNTLSPDEKGNRGTSERTELARRAETVARHCPIGARLAHNGLSAVCRRLG